MSSFSDIVIWFFVIFLAEISAESLMSILHELGIYKGVAKHFRRRKKRTYRRKSAKVLSLREVK